MDVIVEVGGVRLKGRLLETSPALALAGHLPLEVSVARWGDEYYGDVGDALGSFSGARTEVLQVGDLAYWEPGKALCLFFGPTPASHGTEPRAASPVCPVGHVDGDWAAVKALGRSVRLNVRAAG